MGSGAKEANGAKGRTDLLLFDPLDLTVVMDAKGALYDERSEKAVDEWLVLSIMEFGVLEPGIVRKNGADKSGKPIIELVDGRQRRAACIEANRRLKKAGTVERRFPAIIRRDDDKTLMAIMTIANEQRSGDEPIVQAKKAQRLLDFGHSRQEVASFFKWSPGTLTNRLALLDCDPAVQAAIGTELTAGDARAFAKLPREQQKTELKAMRANGGVSKAAVARATGTKARTTPGKKAVEALTFALDTAAKHAENGGEKRRYKFAAQCLRFALGEGDAPEVPKLLNGHA